MTRISIHDLIPGTTYAIQLRSVVDGIVSEWSRTFQLTTTVDAISPKTPANLALSVNGTSFTATWDAVTQNNDDSPATDLDHYVIEISSPSSGITKAYILAGTVFDIPFEMNSAIFGSPMATIGVRVAAVDNVGNTSAYTSVVNQTNPAPSQPANLVVTALQDQVNIKWDAVSDQDLTEYRVYIGTSAGFTPSSANRVFSGKATSFTHLNTNYGADSYYKVSAVDVFGTQSTFATSSAIRPLSSGGTDGTPPAGPTGFSITAPAFDAVNNRASLSLSWTSSVSTDVRAYEIRYSKTGSSDWTYFTVPGDQTTAVIQNVEPGSTYYVQIRSVDFAGNQSSFSNAGTYPITSAKDTAAPSTPAAPTVTTASQKIQVAHSRKKADGTTDMESDVSYYEVYASNSSSFTADSTTMLGTMVSGPVVIETFQIPASAASGSTENWYAKVIAVDRAGNKSAASAASAAAAVGLVGNLQITSLDAAKITANSVFTQDLGVQGTFTLGDATHDGTIKSYDYSAGSAGFKLAKSGLEINQGSIAAAALKIQVGTNLLPPQWADWEFAPSYYTGKMTPENIVAGVASASPAKFGSQYLATIWNVPSANPTVRLSDSDTTYNIPVSAGSQYIVSMYVRTQGTVATQVRLNVKYDNGTTANAVTVTPATSSTTWVRVYGTVTVPAGVSAMLVYLDSTTWVASAGFDVDGVQVEQKLTSLSTPSPWTPPSSTSVDGGYIRTGEIRSNVVTSVNGVDQPNWSINLAGNAQFGNASVRGFILVGNDTDDDDGNSFISSGNYVQGTQGWKIDSAGNADFLSGSFRGNVDAVSGTFSGVLSVTSSGMVTTGTPSDARIELDQAGFRQYALDQSLLVQMPSDPSLEATFSGSISASGITITDNFTLRGQTNEISTSAILKLASGITSSAVPPTVNVNWTKIPIDRADYLAYRRGLYYDGGNLYFGTSIFSVDLEVRDATTGDYVSTGSWFDSDEGNVKGITKIGSSWYVLVYGGTRHSGWWVQVYNSTGTRTAEWLLSSLAQKYDLALGTNGTNLLTAQIQSAGATIFITERNPANGAVVNTYSGAWPSPGQNLTGVMVGTFDFGATRYVVSGAERGSSAMIHSFSLSGTTLNHQPNECWPVAYGESTGGITWDGSNFISMSLDSDNFYRYSTIKWTTESPTWWASYAWRQTTNSYYSTQSNRAKFTMSKRAKVTLSSTPIPSTGNASVDPDAVTFYIGRGSTDPGASAMWLQTERSAGTTSAIYGTVSFSGTNPVSVNGFPGASPAQIISSAQRTDTTPKFSVDATGLLLVDVIRSPYTTGSYLRTRSPGAMLRKNTSTSAATGSYTLISWDGSFSASNVDSTVWNSSDATKLYAPVTGRYRITGSIVFATNATGYRGLNIRMNSGGSVSNGSNIDHFMVQAANGTITAVPFAQDEIYMTAGDYLELFAVQGSGGALNFGGLSGAVTSVGFSYIGPA